VVAEANTRNGDKVELGAVGEQLRCHHAARLIDPSSNDHRSGPVTKEHAPTAMPVVDFPLRSVSRDQRPSELQGPQGKNPALPGAMESGVIVAVKRASTWFATVSGTAMPVPVMTALMPLP